MTNEELLTKIRAEIERRLANYHPEFVNHGLASGFREDGKAIAYEELLSFLSDLEKSLPAKVTDDERLEIEIERVVAEYSEKVQGTKVMKPSGVEKIARRFYDLGCNRTAEKYDEFNNEGLEEAALEIARMETPSGAAYTSFPIYSAFKSGAKWLKGQIMKDAIPCKVFWHDGPLLDYTQEQQDNALERIGANVGDKVRIIIVKED